MCMCSAMCRACELRRAIHTTYVGCGCGSRCGVAVACSAASVPVAAACNGAARAAMARMLFCRGRSFYEPYCIQSTICTVSDTDLVWGREFCSDSLAHGSRPAHTFSICGGRRRRAEVLLSHPPRSRSRRSLCGIAIGTAQNIPTAQRTCRH